MSELVSHCATDGDEIELRDRVLELEKVLARHPNQVEIEVKHYFVNGMYAREILIPKGVLATSKIHLFEHFSIVPKGDISVLTADGVKRIVGPAVFQGSAGVKLLGYAHEDTIWISVEPCQATDPEEAERELVVDTHEQFLLSKKEPPWHLSQ